MTVHNRTRDREEPFAALGATRADSPAEVAIGADLVLTCVSDVPDLEQVVLGDGGIIETIQPGAVRRRLLDRLADHLAHDRRALRAAARRCSTAPSRAARRARSAAR